jgi:toxin ParE1/3/4
VRRVRIAGPAQRDLADILRTSEEQFGAQARSRYRRLIDKALNDVARDPERAGVRSIDDVRPGYFVYHLNFSRRAGTTITVRRPRHLIAFRLDERGDVIVARVFHERQLLLRHLDYGPAD